MVRARKLRSDIGAGHERIGREPRSDGDAKQKRLQQALLSLIAREGTAAVTHRAAAKEAGVSLSATTYYFESKQDMIRSAFELLATELRGQLARLVATYGDGEPGTSSADQEVQAFGAFVLDRMRADEGEIRTMLEMLMTMVRDPRARELLSRDREEIRSFLVSLLGRSHARLDPEEAADLLLSLVTGLLLESLVRGRPRDFEKRAVRIAERVMGWLVRES